jgi:hypothetical protein
VDVRLKEGIDAAFAVDGAQNPWEKAMALTKMSQFFNPLFMPMYDIWQAGGMGGLATSPVAWARGMAKAVKDIQTNSVDLQLAKSLGVMSQPFANPAGDFRATVEDVLSAGGREGMSGMVLDAVRSRVRRIGGRVLKADDFNDFRAPIYNAVMDSAWQTAWGMDQLVRMGTFNTLIAKGFTPEEAAEIASKIHADYADVPAPTRKKFNQFFFTPTFAMSMAKVHTQMVGSALKMMVGRGWGNKVNRRMALGLATSIGMLAGIDAWMKYAGYTTDQWGRRWTKEVRTPQGKETQVVTLAVPLNKTLKYVYWLIDFNDLDPTELGLGRVMDKLKMESGPMIKTVLDVVSNRKMGGGSVYNKFDDKSIQMADAGIYVVNELIGIVDAQLARKITGRKAVPRFANKNERVRRALEKEVPKLIKALNFVQTMHIYSKAGPKRKMAAELNRLNSDLTTEIFFKELAGKEYDQKTWIKNYKKRVNEIVKRERLRSQRARRGR